MAIHTIELFAGVGMLGEGLRAGFRHMGVETRTVCYVEREAYAAAVLAARCEEGSLDAAPVWSDVCTFNAGAWRGKVDGIVAGFPCQDLSVAGKRAGLDGKRSGLFFEVCRIATDSGAWFMFLENVAGITSATATVMDETEGDLDERAASRVVGELADLGWNAEWMHLSASDVGASHGRERWFCFAWKMGHAGLLPGSAQHRQQPKGASCRLGQSGAGSVCVGNPHNDGSEGRCVSAPDGREQYADSVGAGAELADASVTGLERCELGIARNGNRGGQKAHGSASQLRGLFAPGPADERWSGIVSQWREFSPALEPDFWGMVDGVAFSMDESRAARLRCIGNGVVALCAVTAFVILARRAGIFG